MAVKTDAIACFVQTLLYGVYLVSSGHCLRWLVLDSEGRKRPRIHWLMTAVTLALFVLMTANIALVLRMTLISLDGGSAFAYNSTYVVAAGVGVTVLLIVDGVLVYRCWTIYPSSWFTIRLPLALLWIANLASAILGMIFLALNQGWFGAGQQNPAYRSGLNISYALYFAFEIAVNVYATFAIVLRIIRVARWDRRHDSGRLYSIALALAESGALFTITSVLTLCLKLAATGPGLQLASVIMNIINLNTAAFTFNLILIRVYKEKSEPGSDSQDPQDENKTTMRLTTIQFGTSTDGSGTTTEV